MFFFENWSNIRRFFFKAESCLQSNSQKTHHKNKINNYERILLQLSTNRIYFTFDLIKLWFEFILSNPKIDFLLTHHLWEFSDQRTGRTDTYFAWCRPAAPGPFGFKRWIDFSKNCFWSFKLLRFDYFAI